jgi:hypothetical protein
VQQPPVLYSMVSMDLLYEFASNKHIS